MGTGRRVDGWRGGGLATAAAVALLGAVEPSAAGQARVMTDRPDRANSLDTVSPGMAQIETGLAFLRDPSGNQPVRRVKQEGSFRVGLLETVEFDLVGDLFIRERAEGQGTSGIGDTTLAAKWRLLDAEDSRPGLGLLPFVKLPTASRTKGLGSGRVDFGALLATGIDLPADLHVDVNAGLAGTGQEEAPGGFFLQKQANASFSWAATDWLTPFWEIFYESRDRPAGRPTLGTDFGFSVTVHRRVALDVAGEVGLAGAANDWAVRAGFTVLLGSFTESSASAAARRAPRRASAAALFDSPAGRTYPAGMASASVMGERP